MAGNRANREGRRCVRAGAVVVPSDYEADHTIFRDRTSFEAHMDYRYLILGALSSVALAAAGLASAGTTQTASGSPQPAPRAGERFFDERVLPAIAENGCPVCHAQNYVRPRVLEYRELLPYLGMGTSETGNVLIYKMANLRSISPDRPAHPGGKRCATIDSEPCLTFREWWRIEFGNQGSTK